MQQILRIKVRYSFFEVKLVRIKFFQTISPQSELFYNSFDHTPWFIHSTNVRHDQIDYVWQNVTTLHWSHFFFKPLHRRFIYNFSRNKFRFRCLVWILLTLRSIRHLLFLFLDPRLIFYLNISLKLLDGIICTICWHARKMCTIQHTNVIIKDRWVENKVKTELR